MIWVSSYPTFSCELGITKIWDKKKGPGLNYFLMNLLAFNFGSTLYKSTLTSLNEKKYYHGSQDLTRSETFASENNLIMKPLQKKAKL